MAASYSVTSPNPTCAITGEPLEPGDACISLLYETDSENMARLDVSVAAWEGGGRPVPPSEADRPGAEAAKLVAIWRTTVREKDAPRRVLIGDGEVLDLFDQLGDAEEGPQLAFRYLLCLILIRKKQLVWEGARPATGGEPGVVLVRHRRDKEGPVIEVVDPGMDNDSIEAATKQLSAVMNLEAGT